MSKDDRWERHESLPAQDIRYASESTSKQSTITEEEPADSNDNDDEFEDKDITLQTSKDFVQDLVKAKQGVSLRFNKFGNLKIPTFQGDKTIEEWGKVFHVPIPDDGDTEALIRAGAKAASLYSVAVTNLEQASITNLTLKKELESKEGDLFSRIKRLKENGKAPSDRSVQARVASHPEIISLNNQLAISDFIVKFWDSKKQQLVYTRRTLEMIGYARGAELKSLHHGASFGNKDS